MSLSKLLFYVSLSAISAVGLSGCASVVDTPNQQIEIVTPGALNASCEVRAGNTIYQALPPQKITVHNTRHPIKVDCVAPGNRYQSVEFKADVAGMAYANIANGGAGAIYDMANGAMFKYPDQISVDFTSVAPQLISMPAYEELDGKVPGYEPMVEHMGHTTVASRTSYERDARSGWVDEKERRKSSVNTGYKGAPEFASPYTPEPTFPGTTSF